MTQDFFSNPNSNSSDLRRKSKNLNSSFSDSMVKMKSQTQTPELNFFPSLASGDERRWREDVGQENTDDGGAQHHLLGHCT
jgi:hypothetical protein